MTPLEQLLVVQELDTHADQLRHRRATMPERAELEQRQNELAAVDAAAATVETQKRELVQQQRRLEDEVTSVEAKATDVDKTLYSGTVRIPRELQALQDEIAALGRRKSQLEDEILELMEQIEPLDAELGVYAGKRESIDSAAVALIAAITEAESQIDAELADVDGRRAAAVAGVPVDLLEQYDKLRVRLGGIAIARLTGNRCEGCHLTLPAMEVDTIRRAGPDELVHCSECDRLLVR